MTPFGRLQFALGQSVCSFGLFRATQNGRVLTMSHELLHTHTHLHFFIKVYFIHTHTHTLYFLYPQQRGKKTLLSLTLICYCHLVSKAEIVRGSAALLQYDHETPLLVDLADLLYISTALHCLVAADPFTGDVSAGHLTIALFTLYHLPTRFFSFLWFLHGPLRARLWVPGLGCTLVGGV